MGFRKSTRDVEDRAQQRSTPVKREAAVAGLASEGLALVSGSAGAGNNTVVVPTPTDPVEFRKSTRDLKALSASKEYTNEERGGGHDPGVRRPGAGRGQLQARSNKKKKNQNLSEQVVMVLIESPETGARGVSRGVPYS